MRTNVTVGDLLLIGKISERAIVLFSRYNLAPDEARISDLRLTTADEILTVHRDVVPLRLADMERADDFNFLHDVVGIRRHLVRGEEPRLSHCFRPRFAGDPR